MSMIIRFAPWLVFLVLAHTVDWRVGLAAGLVAQVIAIVATRRRPGVLDVAMLVFFTVMGAYALVRPDSPVQDVLGSISALWMAAVAGVSNLLGRPFTMDFSNDVSPEIAASALYRSIHRTIAWAWTGAFAAMGIAGLAAKAAGNPRLSTWVTVVLIVVCIKFTKDYPDRAVAAAHDAPQQTPLAVG